MSNPALEFHIRALKDVIYKLKSNIKSINLIKIRKDLSFELILKIIQERIFILFSDILNMKNYDNKISEINTIFWAPFKNINPYRNYINPNKN